MLAQPTLAAACCAKQGQASSIKEETSCLCVRQLAAAAREQTNGYKLDKSHTFAVNMFDEFDKYDRVPLEYEPYQKREYQPQA